MTIKTTYICDYCGAEFDEEEDCEVHEQQERYAKTKENVTFFDSDFEPFNSSDTVFCIEDICGIHIKNKEGRQAVKDFYEDAGYTDPLWNYPESDIIYPMNLVFNDSGDWDNLDEKVDYWNRIKNTFTSVEKIKEGQSHE